MLLFTDWLRKEKLEFVGGLLLVLLLVFALTFVDVDVDEADDDVGYIALVPLFKLELFD